MILHSLTIPDDPATWPAWLEGQLVSLDLGALIAELEAVHGPPAEGDPTLEGVIGGHRDAVLAEGLAALPSGALGTLLRHPRLLLELQGLVLASGGERWTRAVAPDARVGRGRVRLDAWMGGEVVPARPIGRGRRPWFVGLAMAASVLAAFVGFEVGRERTAGPVAWGWDRPGALPQDVPRDAYLARLADEAGEWFAKRPDDPSGLARRIVEFRRGCSTLILADHRPLSAEDRAWLVAKCRAWASRLDAHLAAVEAGKAPLAVRAEADETVRKLIAALRGRTSRPA